MEPAAKKQKRKRDDAVSDEDEILELELKASESPKYYNNISKLLDHAFPHGRDPQPLAILALSRVFVRLSADGWFRSKSHSSQTKVVRQWLADRLGQFTGSLLSLAHGAQHASLAITALMKLAQQLVSSGSETWTDGLFAKIVKMVMKQAEAQPVFLHDFFSKYLDVQYYTTDILCTELSGMAGKADADLLSSAIRILVAIPKSDGQLTDCFSATENDPAKLTRLLRKKLQETWMIVLRSSMSKSQRKTILRNAVDNILPTLPRGEILMDFFTDSFGFGGEMSLLALSGLFHLMMEKNLDYPLFYRKLYSLLDEGLVWSVHRSRIFRLLDVCLGSTHLPAALVASFIKRLSRLALRAPPAAIVIAIPWIYNLFKMHATCTFMMHRVVGKDEPVEDPFDMEEEDPMLTGAIDSCVWELVSLQSHYHPNVATLAKIISEQFTKQQYNMEDFLDYSYASLLDSEMSKSLKKQPVVEVQIPKSILESNKGGQSLGVLLDHVLQN